MQMNTSKKATTTAGAGAAQPTPNGAIMKLDVAKQAQDMKARIERINDLARKTSYLFRVRESLHDLQSFTIESGDSVDGVVLRDSEGRTWRSANSFLIKKVVSTLIEEFERKNTELEMEIVSATI